MIWKVAEVEVGSVGDIASLQIVSLNRDGSVGNRDQIAFCYVANIES